MQCPSCGFENLPGLTRCGSCQTNMESQRLPESVTPPRARDRTLRQKAAATLEKLEHTPLVQTVSTHSFFSNQQIKKTSLALAAVIPGLSLLISRRRIVAGVTLSVFTLAFAIGTALFYLSVISNLLVCLIIALSIWSLNIQLHINNPGEILERYYIRSIIVAFGYMVFIFIGIQLMVSLPNLPIGLTRVVHSQTRALFTGDWITLRRGQTPSKGSVVLATFTGYGDSLDRVVGLPGDSYTLSEEGELIVGDFYRRRLSPEEYQIFTNELGNYGKIPEGEYLLASRIGLPPNPVRGASMLVPQTHVQGVVTAIIWPAAHRHRFDEGEN